MTGEQTTGSRGAGEPLPFVSEDRLEAACRRLAQGGRAESLLLASAVHTRTRADLADPLLTEHAALPFVVQNVLLECSLAYRLSGDDRHLGPVRDLFSRLADPVTVHRRLPDEIYLGFAAVGAAVAYRLSGRALDADLARHVLLTLGSALEASSRSDPWGQSLPRRFAWNHSAVGWVGLGTLGMALPDTPQGPAWAAVGMAGVQRFLEFGITDTGLTREGLDYAGGFVFRNIAPFLLACRATGIWDYRDPTANPWLDRMRRVPRWYAAAVLPQGRWLDNLNDSNGNPGRALGGLLPLFSPLAPDMCAWVHDRLVGAGAHDRQGQDLAMRASALFESVLWPPPPPPPTSGLPDVMIDGDVGLLWESPATGRGLLLNCGPFLGGLHDQSDNGHLGLWDQVPLLLDSGAANDPVEGSVSSSAGHNVALIDGRGQLPSGAGAGSSGSFLRVTTSPHATLACCDLTPAYTKERYVDVARAVRHVLHVKAPVPYVLVVDDIVPTRRGAFVEQLFHTPAQDSRRFLPTGFEVRAELDGATARLRAQTLDPARVRTTSMTASAPPFREHTVWRLGRVGAGPYASVLVTSSPAPTDDAEPEVSIHGEVVRFADHAVIRIVWQGADAQGCDELIVPCAVAPATLTRDGVPFDGEVLLASSSARPPAPAGTRTDAAAGPSPGVSRPLRPVGRLPRPARLQRRVVRVLRSRRRRSGRPSA